MSVPGCNSGVVIVVDEDKPKRESKQELPLIHVLFSLIQSCSH